MDGSGHHENGPEQYKTAHGQLMLHQLSMNQIVAILAEKNAAIQERNLALSQRKAAIAERNIALMQRDQAISERNNAIMERDNAIAALQYLENSLKTCRPDGAKETETMASNKKALKVPDKVKRESEDSEWKDEEDLDGGEDHNREYIVSNSDWKYQDLGLNQVAFDETTMPPPGCSCTGILRQCYRCGNGGWQSSCCTTTLSMYPLPSVPNKRHARIGGRKMSGSVFSKLLSRLGAEGHDLSTQVDLKDHWAKHGTNQYITIK